MPYVTDPTADARACGSRWRGWLVAWLCVGPIALLRAGTMAESDTFWQVRTGLLILADGSIPNADPFSWTAGGKPWTINSWGFDVLIALAHLAAGLGGVAVFGAFLVMVVAASVLLLARAWGASPVIAGTLLLLTAPLLIAWLSVRPQLVDYIAVPLLAVLMTALTAGASAFRTIALAAMLGVMWVNLHAASLLGVGLCLAAGAAWWTSRQRREGILALIMSAVLLCASTANPLGAGLFSQTWGVREASVQVITEWLPVDVGDGQQVVMLLIGVVGLTLSVRARNTLAVALLLVLIAGSVLAMRLLPLLVLVSVPAIAASLSRPRVEAFLRSRRVVLVPGAVTAVLALLALASSAMTHLGRPLPDLYPQQVVHDIPPGCRLFNSYTLGGFVILTRPDVLVSIDSRNDLYGADRVAANTHAVEAGQMHHPDLQRAGCVLVPPDTRLALALSADNAWTLTASERAAVLFTRRG